MSVLNFRFLPATAVLRRLAVAAAVLFCLGGCQLADYASMSLANARADTSWNTKAGYTEVPFRVLNDHILVPVSVNGSETLEFVLDTGADMTVLMDSVPVQALSLEPDSRIPISGTGQGFDAYADIVTDVSLSLGELSLNGLSVIHIPMQATAFFENREQIYFDGVIGYEFFQRFLVRIDYDRGVVGFYDREHFHSRQLIATGDWVSVDMPLRGTMPYVQLEMVQSSGRKLDLELLLDTGSTGTLSLSPDSDGDLRLPERYYESVSIGVNGSNTDYVSPSKQIRFGGRKFDNVATHYASAGNSGGHDGNGILGNRILSRFNLLIDYETERLYLQANQRSEWPLVGDHSGLQILPVPEGAFVRRVDPSSPAWRIGLREQDVIESMGGKAIGDTGFDNLKNSLRQATGTMELCWRRDGQGQCAQLTLQDRYRKRA